MLLHLLPCLDQLITEGQIIIHVSFILFRKIADVLSCKFRAACQFSLLMILCIHILTYDGPDQIDRTCHDTEENNNGNRFYFRH